MTSEARVEFPIEDAKSPLFSELFALLDPSLCADDKTYDDFRKRLGRGKLTREEDPASHFGVFILPRDPKTGEVLLGLHKKANTWIPPGGHIEQGETTKETLRRETGEELGVVLKENDERIGGPFFFSTVEIEDPNRSCEEHYDTWYLLIMSKNQPMKVNDEFAETKWINPEVAIRSGEVTDPSTLKALEKLIKQKDQIA